MNKQSATVAVLQFVRHAVPHAVNVLSSISVCVCVCLCACILCMHANVCCVCVCACGFTRLGTADPLWVVFIFHSLPMSSHKALALSFFPSSSSSSSCSPPSIYLLITVTWIISDREELSFERTNSCYKSQGEEKKLYFDSHSSGTWWVYKCSLCLRVYLLTDFSGKHQCLRWAGNKRCCVQGKHSNFVFFQYSFFLQLKIGIQTPQALHSKRVVDAG